MNATVHGIYKQGRVELLERPEGVSEGPVLVTLQSEEAARAEPRRLEYGKYRDGRLSDESDFKIAEWSGGEAIDGA